jgi:hypothetical protein
VAGDDTQAHRKAIDRMVAMCGGLGSVDIKGRNSRLFLIAYGWTAQVYRFAQALLVLVDAGFEHEARVLVRSILEYTITLDWLTKVGENGVDAVVRQHQRSMKAIHASTDPVFKNPEMEAALRAVLAADVPKVDEEEALRVFKTICEELGIDETLYIVYRVECSFSHPTLAAASEYDATLENGGAPAVRVTPTGGLGVVALTAHCLVWAGRALDTLLVNRPLRKELQEIARSIGCAPTLPHRTPPPKPKGATQTGRSAKSRPGRRS